MSNKDIKLVQLPSPNFVPERDKDKPLILEVSHLGIDFGGLTAVNEFNIGISPTEIAGLIGPNGAGKTTVFNLLTGVYKPDSGIIKLDGEDITALDPTERAKKGVAFAFQQPVRFKGISVRKLLSIAAGRTLTDEELNDVLRSVGVQPEQYIDRQVDTKLSGGEIKRIEIASVLLRNARVAVFDEPEAGIDLWSFQNLIRIFEKMRKEIKDSSIVIISHQERILNIADEIVVIADGRITDTGSPEKVLPKLLGTEAAVDACARLQ